MFKARRIGLGRLIVVLAALLALAPLSGLAQRPPVNPPPVEIQAIVVVGTCVFDVGVNARMQTWTLQDSCMTTETIIVPHATTLDGDGHIITAVSPENSPFLGAVITNEPVTTGQPRVTINVTNVEINAGNLQNGCYPTNADRLRGVWLNGASGSVTDVTILALNRGPSGCQEGNGIEAVNYDESSHPTRVTIANNTVLNWMKTGIVANLNVDARIINNYVGESSNEDYLAPNSIQIGFGASADLLNNNVHGSQWLGDWEPGETNYVSAGFLIYQAGGLLFNGNTLNYNPLEGNAEIGLFITDSDNGRYIRNTIFDNGVDRSVENGGYWDIGISSDCDSTGNLFGANQVSGFDVATDICYTGPGRPLGATSMTTLSRGAGTDDVEAPPPVPQPFI